MLAFSDIAVGGTSDKVYHVNLNAALGGLCTVTVRYGRRNGPLAFGNKTKNGAVTYELAKGIFEAVIAEKIAKGYVRIVSVAVEWEARALEALKSMPQNEEVTEAGFTAALKKLGPDCDAQFVRPQELLTEITDMQCAHLVLDDAHFMQDKSDGHARGVVKTSEGWIYGLNKLGKRVALSEHLQMECERIPFEVFQIDGELVGEKLVCRDLLYADGDLSALPYSARLEKLVAAILPLKVTLLSVVETWEGSENKTAALKRQLALHREGVVFKLRSASHRAGRSGQHKKFKFVKTLSAIAGTPRSNGKDSVEIFLIDSTAHPDGVRRVGTVSLIGKDAVKAGDVLEIAYLYAHPSKMLQQARMMAKRIDVLPSQCTIAQLQYKAEVQ